MPVFEMIEGFETMNSRPTESGVLAKYTGNHTRRRPVYASAVDLGLSTHRICLSGAFAGVFTGRNQANPLFLELAPPFSNRLICLFRPRFPPFQGRVFLSPRQLAFYSNIFGHKTQFSIAWEDVDEIRENSTSVSKFTRLLNPYVTLYARKGRALDAKLGSYGVDNKGRLKFRFQSFVKPGPAMR